MIQKTCNMKKISLAAFLCALSFFGTAQIDLTANPLGMMWGDFGLGADYCFNSSVSSELGLGFGGDSGTDDNSNEYSYKNLNISGMVKYYFSPTHGSDNFYSGGFVKYINRNYEHTDIVANNLIEYDQSRIGAGVLFGTKRASEGGFIFDFNFGVGKAFIDDTSFTGDDTIEVNELPAIMFIGKLSIGYRLGVKSE